MESASGSSRGSDSDSDSDGALTDVSSDAMFVSYWTSMESSSSGSGSDSDSDSDSDDTSPINSMHDYGTSRRTSNGFIAQLPQIGRNPLELRASFVTSLWLSSDEAASAIPGEHWPIPMRILPGSNLRTSWMCELHTCNHVDFVLRMVEVDILRDYLESFTAESDALRAQNRLAHFLGHSLALSGVPLSMLLPRAAKHLRMLNTAKKMLRKAWDPNIHNLHDLLETALERILFVHELLRVTEWCSPVHVVNVGCYHDTEYYSRHLVHPNPICEDFTRVGL